jgi:hypothetical protein
MPEDVERIPLRFQENFSWHAVGAVIAEKFGLRGARIAAMIGLMIGYLAYRGCTSTICTLLYGFATVCVVLFIAVMWAAKDTLDKFVAKHRDNAWLTVDETGVGGESGAERFHVPWKQFRRVRQRGAMWLMETRQGSWMVVPSRDFTARAWTLFRAQATPPGTGRKCKRN